MGAGLLLILGGLACAPYRPPAEPPPLVRAQGPLRVVEGGLIPRVIVRAGSAYDPPGREGLAAVLAHGLAARVGSGAQVTPDWVSFGARPDEVPTDDPALAALFGALPSVQALAEALSAPLDAEVLAAGLAAVRARRPPSCPELLQDAVAAWVFAGHPYGHPAAGRTGVLDTLSLGELQAFHAARYVRDAVLVAGSGELAGRVAPAFAPALSRSPTPAVWSRTVRPPVRVAAPVAEGCSGRAVGGLRDWTAEDEGMAYLLATLQGQPPPALRVEPVLVSIGPESWSAYTPTTEASQGDLQDDALAAWMVASTWGGERELLASVRGARVPEADAVRRAILGATEASFDAWVARRFASAVRVEILPADAESPAAPGVLTYEALLR